VTDFVNLKIKSAQSFRGAHRGRVCVRVFVGVSSRTYEYLYLYCVSQKKKSTRQNPMDISKSMHIMLQGKKNYPTIEYKKHD
jgi:hypothetical protein